MKRQNTIRIVPTDTEIKNINPNNMSLDINKVRRFLLEDGPLAGRLGNYEVRLPQTKMLDAVTEAISENTHLMVEAGTGVGKSMAYLLPFISWAKKDGKRIIVSTYTKTLQEQLFRKDLPFLKQVLGQDDPELNFDFALCVGSENYLCLRRLHRALQDLNNFDAEQKQDFLEIKRWSNITSTGLIMDLDFSPHASVWQEVSRESDLCRYRKCRHYSGCFYRRAREIQKNAHILVVNHYLFFANLVSGGRALPYFDAVVFDEAHTLEDVASEYLGIHISDIKLRRLLTSIYNPMGNKGLIMKIDLPDIIRRQISTQVVSALEKAQAFFTTCGERFNKRIGSYRLHSSSTEDTLSQSLLVLYDKINTCLDVVGNNEDREDLHSYGQRILDIQIEVQKWIGQTIDNFVYWLEISPKKRTKVILRASPVEVAGYFKDIVWGKIHPAVLTSATLSVSGNFDFIKQRIGFTEGRCLSFGSPFDYKKKVLLYIAEDLADPSSDIKDFELDLILRVEELLKFTRGRTFVLFTSFDMLNNCFFALRDRFPELNMLSQGIAPRYKIIDSFKENDKSVLFGTYSFWQGVDMPGRLLECVIITKLPFMVPSDPLYEARIELMKREGKNPFLEYQLPQAVIMLRQGFGRLIRHKSDRGVVSILDPRILARHYGKNFLEALPECRITKKVKDVGDFFNFS